MKTPILRIGIVLRPQGIRGEVKIQPLTDDPARFKKLKTVLLEIDGEHRETGISVERIEQDAVYAYLQGYYTRNAAENLRDVYLCVRREEAVPLPENTWFVADLLGLNVVSDGKTIGRMAEVIPTGAVDVYRVEKTEGGSLLFPALKRLLTRIDLDESVMELDSTVLEEVRVDED